MMSELSEILRRLGAAAVSPQRRVEVATAALDKEET